MRNYQIAPLRNICRQHPQWQVIQAATSIKQISPQIVNQIVSAFLLVLVREKNTTDQANTIYARARFRDAIGKKQL